MLAPKGPTFNGRPTFANPMYLKKAQFEKPCLYAIPYDQSDPTNRLVPDKEETLTLEKESRSKLNKDKVRPYDYTKLNSLYEIFKPPTQEYHVQLAHANEQEMQADLKYVESLEKEIDELESDKVEFSNMYDILLQECVSNDVMCSYLHSLSDLDAHTELQCLYLHKVKECECLAQKLSKQTESVSKEVYTELLQSFAKLKKHSISLELALQQCQEQMKNDTVCKEKASHVFQKQHEQYFNIQDLKAQLQDKNIAIWVTHKTNVSRPQLRSTQMKDKVVPNTSQVKFKKIEVEDQHRISSTSNKTKSVTACNDSLKSKTLNVNAVCATCGKCVFNSIHDACVSKFLNAVNARTKKPKNSKSYYRMLYEKTSKAWKWWIEQQCPSGYKWVPKTKMKWVPKVRNENVQKRVSFAIDNASRITDIVQLILFIVDSGCTKHMTGNLKLLCNFIEKYLGIVYFGNDQFALIIGYGDLVQGNITINRVYYVEGLNHNLFSIGQFCDADLGVAFRKSMCFVRDLQGNDLLTGNRGTDLYTISLQETTSLTLNCLMAKASPTQAWLWHRGLSHLNFDYINLLSKEGCRLTHRTNVSRPQLRSTQIKDKVMPNTSQVKFKKIEVEDQHRISSTSNKTKSVTACNDSLKSKTLNVNAVYATCGKCVFNSIHDACVYKFLNAVNARTKKPKNSKSYYRMLYEKTSKAWKWWIEQQYPSGYKWVPKTKMKWVPKVRNENVQKRVNFAIDNASRITDIVQLILFIVDSGCTKHMTGNLKLLCNFIEKYLGTIYFGNDQFALIIGCGDLVQGNITINRVYYVEGLNHNLFSIGQFCDADLGVAFRKSMCFVRDL
ncbi:hypothetical protein Tco_1106688 [Tanacetum coccineum]